MPVDASSILPGVTYVLLICVQETRHTNYILETHPKAVRKERGEKREEGEKSWLFLCVVCCEGLRPVPCVPRLGATTSILVQSSILIADGSQ